MIEIKNLDKDIKKILALKYPVGIVIGGLPGVGKSTLTDFFVSKGFLSISKDDIRYKLANSFYEGEKSESELESELENYSVFTHIIIECMVLGYNNHIDKVSLNTVNNHIDKRIDSYFVEYNKYHEAPSELVGFIKNMIKDVIANIYNNSYARGIIFDATHFTKKQRHVEINYVNNHMPMYAIYLDDSAENAIQGIKKRSSTIISYNGNKAVYGRFVPSEVVFEMQKNIVLPSINEGFVNAIIINHNINDMHEYKNSVLNLYKENNLSAFINDNFDIMSIWFPSLIKCVGYNQENIHHSLPLDQHIIGVAEKCKSNPILFLSALLHDVGKIYTKVYTANLIHAEQGLNENRKLIIINNDGNQYTLKNYDGKLYTVNKDNLKICNSAHFYNHENVGAVIARRELKKFGFSDSFINRVYNLILFHMYLPFHDDEITQKQKAVIRSTFSFDDINNLVDLRLADASAGKDISEESMNNIERFRNALIE